MQITQVLRRAVQVNADAEATVMGSRRRNYRQLYDRVARLAGALRALGIDKGDRVAILALNSDRYMEYFFAVWWTGAVVVPLNTRWASAEHHYALEDSGAKALFYDQNFSSSLPELATALPESAAFVCVDDGHIHFLLSNSWIITFTKIKIKIWICYGIKKLCRQSTIISNNIAIVHGNSTTFIQRNNKSHTVPNISSFAFFFRR